MHTYCIQLAGQIDVNELNAMSPHQMTAVQASPTATVLSIRTDQSGMIGLLRHLHSLGLTLLSVNTTEEMIEELER